MAIHLCFPLSVAHAFSQIFNDATEYFSHSTPSLAMVIPVMDIIDNFLDDNSKAATLCPSI
jgi:hypothetical protein